MAKVFISYRRSDTRKIVGRIYDKLIDRFGPSSVFWDRTPDSIAAGDDFARRLNEGVRQSRVVLALIGDEWLEKGLFGLRLSNQDDHLRKEIEVALENDITIIPVMIDIKKW